VWRILWVVDAAQIVREGRRRAGLTQRRLAELAGVSQPLVARIESGEVQPTLERVLELVRAAGLDLDVRVVPLDEDAWTMAERGAAATPDERLDRAVAGVRLLEEGRRLRGET
jgi:predicted transcriptional regulator